MWKLLLKRLGLRSQPLNQEERLRHLQRSLIGYVRHGRDEDDASAVALAIRADALLKQDKPFEVRCQEVHDAVIAHSAQKLLNRLDSYSH